MSESLELFDVTIIGGGPAGMYTAFYSGMRDLKTKLIEAQNELGGFLHTYPEKMIWDVGGIPPMRCDKLIVWLEQQARTFDPTLVFNQKIVGVVKQEDGNFLLTSTTGEQHLSRTVIVTVGRGITQIQKLDIQGADRYEVTNLHYTIQELISFRGKRVLISGGGNSAVDWANELTGIGAEVIVIHRRDQFKAMEKHVADMMATADVRTPYFVSQLNGQGETIHSVTITNAETGETEVLDVDAVVVNHGYTSDYGPIAEWGIELGEWAINVSNRLATNVPGIFAAGDCVHYDSKVRLIAGTFTDAVLALNSAKLYMEPEADHYAYVSSHNVRFKERNKQLHIASLKS